MLKRAIALLISLALFMCATSCSVINIISDVINLAIGDSANKSDYHEYTADAYDFPTQIGDFKSLPRTDYLCYQNLTEAQKIAYDHMYESAMQMDKALFYVGDCTADDVTVAFHALTYDCPYIVWLSSSYGVSEQSDGTYVQFVDPEGNYNYIMTPQERDKALDDMYSEIDLFITQNILPTMTDYEIELAVHDWLCQQITYDQEAADAVKNEQEHNSYNAWTAYGAIVENRAVCAGYSNALQLVLNYLGVRCASLRVMSEGEMHMLCVVKLGDAWVYVDPTWNDKEACGLKYTHDYFNLSYAEISKTHTVFEPYTSVLDKGQELNSNFNVYIPPCESEEYNYYKLSGLQIEHKADFKGLVTRNFKNAVEKGEYSLEFQLTYCEPTNDTIDALINGYRLIEEIERFSGAINHIQYAVLNNGAFCMTLSLKEP